MRAGGWPSKRRRRRRRLPRAAGARLGASATRPRRRCGAAARRDRGRQPACAVPRPSSAPFLLLKPPRRRGRAAARARARRPPAGARRGCGWRFADGPAPRPATAPRRRAARRDGRRRLRRLADCRPARQRASRSTRPAKALCGVVARRSPSTLGRSDDRVAAADRWPRSRAMPTPTTARARCSWRCCSTAPSANERCAGAACARSLPTIPFIGEARDAQVRILLTKIGRARGASALRARRSTASASRPAPMIRAAWRRACRRTGRPCRGADAYAARSALAGRRAGPPIAGRYRLLRADQLEKPNAGPRRKAALQAGARDRARPAAAAQFPRLCQARAGRGYRRPPRR